jgi:DNA-binding NarL/FixJ family response regulator
MAFAEIPIRRSWGRLRILFWSLLRKSASRPTTISLVFCSDELPGGGIDRLIRQCSQLPKRVPLVVVSRFDDWKRYLDFLQASASDYLLLSAQRARD